MAKAYQPICTRMEVTGPAHFRLNEFNTFPHIGLSFNGLLFDQRGSNELVYRIVRRQQLEFLVYVREMSMGYRQCESAHLFYSIIFAELRFQSRSRFNCLLKLCSSHSLVSMAQTSVLRRHKRA